MLAQHPDEPGGAAHVAHGGDAALQSRLQIANDGPGVGRLVGLELPGSPDVGVGVDQTRQHRGAASVDTPRWQPLVRGPRTHAADAIAGQLDANRLVDEALAVEQTIRK